MRTIYDTVRGVTFENRQALIKKYARNGQIISIQPEPNNKHDKNALAIYIQSGLWIFKKFHHIGYINADLANEGLCFQQEAKILKVTGGGIFSKKNYGVSIELTILDENDEGYISSTD
jgi:hypothetical protein